MINSFGQEIPDKLYKYMPWQWVDSEGGKRNYTKELIENSQFYLSLLDDFNDPFDGKIYVSHEKKIDIVELIRKSKLHPKIKIIEKIDVLREEAKNNDEKRHILDELEMEISNEGNEKISKELQDAFRRKAKGTCFTTDNRNILMWAHYANAHKGVCLEFQNLCCENIDLGTAMEKITYSDKYPVMNIKDFFTTLKENDDLWVDVARSMYLRKFDAWAYEDEYRLLNPTGEHTFVPFSSENLTGIIFGCRMDDKDKESIIAELPVVYKPFIKFYEARENLKKYQLDILPLR